MMQRRKEKQKKSLHMYVCLVVKYRTTNWTNFKASSIVVVTRLALAWIPSYVPYIPYHTSMPFSEKLDIYHLPSHTSTRSNNQPLSSPSQPTIVPVRALANINNTCPPLGEQLHTTLESIKTDRTARAQPKIQQSMPSHPWGQTSNERTRQHAKKKCHELDQIYSL